MSGNATYQELRAVPWENLSFQRESARAGLFDNFQNVVALRVVSGLCSVPFIAGKLLKRE
jgi:hypothetical protein